MEELIESSDYALAQKWAIEVAGEPNQAQLIIPEDRFIKAVRNSNSVSLTTSDEKLFGLGLGINPPIDPDFPLGHLFADLSDSPFDAPAFPLASSESGLKNHSFLNQENLNCLQLY